MSQLPVVVTGAAGLVGNAVARRLLARGADVIAVDQRGMVDPGGLRVLDCDLLDVHRLHALTRNGIAGVIHCGAYSGPMVARDKPHSMVQVNVLGTANMLELARVHGARRFVFASSTTVYGHTGRGPVTEEFLPRPQSLYAASKVASEQLVTTYAVQEGLDGASIRLSWVYGPRRTTDCVIRTMIENAHSGRPTRFEFGADFPRQFIHVDDAASALIAALDAPSVPRRVYNATGGVRHTLSEIAGIVRGVLPHADISLSPGPDPLDQHQDLMDISAAAEDLSYSPSIDIEAGISSYADWLRHAPSP